MVTSKRLLPALLLTFAACKMSTDDLAPKTDAECAASGKKACGYKCVDKNDPATGCGDPGCTPCAGGAPNAHPACTREQKCGYTCEKGWGDCDSSSPGCETRVDANNAYACGACFRTCSTGCVGGTCNSVTYFAAGEPRGIALDSASGRVFWVDDGNLGEILSIDEYSNASPPLATMLDERPGSPAVSRIAFDVNGSSFVWATGASSSGLAQAQVAVFRIDPASPTPPGLKPVPYWSEPEQVAMEGFQGLSVVAGQVFFTRESMGGPCVVTATGGSSTCVTPGGTAVHGLLPRSAPPAGFAMWYGYPDYGGSLMYVDPTGRQETFYAVGIGSWPSRLAVYDGPPAPQWFWADESTGNVWRVPPSPTGGATVPELIDVGTGHPTEMDIQADLQGVVWSDRWAGKVRAWRGYDEAIFDVAKGGQPRGVALTLYYIFWTDAQKYTIEHVPR